MIVSASRRTDIPAFYSDWLLNRIHEGYVLVRNPFNPKMVSRIDLRPEVVDCIVFWTKNPAPLLGKLDRLKEYNYYFQFTVNPYGKELETHLPPLSRRLDTFKRLSDKIGREKVIWRYDPVLTNREYTIAFHQEKFAAIVGSLKDYTEKCMLGFIDHYRHILPAVSKHAILPLQPGEIEKMAVSFRKTTDAFPPLHLETCTTKVDLSHLGIPAGLCIDDKLIERITGYPIKARKDKNQRDICNCAESIDIGTYETCLNGCIYCYAIRGNDATARRNAQTHDKNSPLLTGNLASGDIVKERPMKSLRDDQLNLF